LGAPAAIRWSRVPRQGRRPRPPWCRGPPDRRGRRAGPRCSRCPRPTPARACPVRPGAAPASSPRSSAGKRH